MEEQEIKAATEQPEAEALPVDESAAPVEAPAEPQPEAAGEEPVETSDGESAEPAEAVAEEMAAEPVETVVEAPAAEDPEPAAAEAPAAEDPEPAAAEAPAAEDPEPAAAEEPAAEAPEPAAAEEPAAEAPEPAAAEEPAAEDPEQAAAEEPAAPETAADNPQVADDEVFEAVFEQDSDARESVSAEQLLGEQSQPAGEEDSARTELKAVLEAIVYVLNEPMPAIQIAAALGRDIKEVEPVLQLLAEETSRGDRGIFIREVAGGYQMATKPEHHDVLRTFVKNLKQPLKLSQAALETLAVIAYKQPITMPEILEIRGVQGGGVVKTLIDRKLITTAGRKNVIGKPMLYKTTKEFLTQFGLKDVNELPSLKEFEEIRRQSIADDEIVGTAQQPLLPAGEEMETIAPAPENAAEADATVESAEPATAEAASATEEPVTEPQPATEPEPEAPPATEQEKSESPDA
jgi:segregation and condensation protein B